MEKKSVFCAFSNLFSLMRLSLLSFLLFFALAGNAQSPQYRWAQRDGNVSYTSGISSMQQVVAGHEGKALWGVIQNRKRPGTPSLGDYKLMELDSNGATLITKALNGNLGLIQAAADAAGNWYVLGTYYDSVGFAGGPALLRSTAGGQSKYFMARLQKGTLQPAWLVSLGENAFCETPCFTMAAGGIYFAIDSSYGTSLNRLDVVTGVRTKLWNQVGRSYTSAIQADAAGNIYLLGTCAEPTGISFNGTSSLPPASFSYPWYIARYKAGGSLHWNHWASDITCPARSLKLSGNNALYVTGDLNDSVTLLGHFFTRPTQANGKDYLSARVDSSGTLVWAQQRPAGATGNGSYDFENDFHTVFLDTALYLFCTTNGATDWAGGLQTTGNGKFNATLVGLNAGSGNAFVARAIGTNFSLAQQIATDGSRIWITGVGRDSTALRFDTVSVAVPQLKTVPFLAMIKVRETPPAGIAGIQKVQSFFEVFPNPAGQALTIQSPQHLTYRLLDVAGRTLLSGVLKTGTATISVGNLPRGFYLLEGISAGGKQVQRVVLE